MDRAEHRGMAASPVRAGEVGSESELSQEEEGSFSAPGPVPVAEAPGGPVGQVPAAGAGSGGVGGAMPRVDVGTSLGIAAGWLKRSLSEATWSAYSRVWAEWWAFLREVGVAGRGSDRRWVVLYWVARNIEKGLSPASIERKLAGLAFLFKLWGEPDGTKDFWVRQTLKGYRRDWKGRDARRPVSFDNLVAICSRLGDVCSSAYETVLFTAAFSLAFYGAFRIGELVCRSKRVAGGLLDQDVQVVADRVSIRLRRSKTDQRGKGVAITLLALPGSVVCPVAAVRAFRAVRPGRAGPFLVHEEGSFLSRFQFVSVFRQCLRAVGLDERDYASHSFRIGAATEAARCGLEEAVVRRIGRWESRRFRSYVRPQLLLG
ncbi:integrase/recombinase xerD homolog [Lithobates pipiens]